MHLHRQSHRHDLWMENTIFFLLHSVRQSYYSRTTYIRHLVHMKLTLEVRCWSLAKRHFAWFWSDRTRLKWLREPNNFRNLMGIIVFIQMKYSKLQNTITLWNMLISCDRQIIHAINIVPSPFIWDVGPWQRLLYQGLPNRTSNVSLKESWSKTYSKYWE